MPAFGETDSVLDPSSFPKYSAEKKKEDEEGELLPGVVLLTGLMETMAKYGETISYFNER